MGLDTVELLMRAEEVFEVDLPVERLEAMRTVGDLYRVVCEKLGIEALAFPDDSMGYSHRSRLQGWTAENVWATLVGVVVDQLQVDVDQVRSWARLQEDLGCD